jgi:hypothetical protein
VAGEVVEDIAAWVSTHPASTPSRT